MNIPSSKYYYNIINIYNRDMYGYTYNTQQYRVDK